MSIQTQIIRTILVDDELAARETLRTYLLKYCKGIEIVGEACDVPSAIAIIKELKPALVFLDVEMPFGNAFDVLEQSSEQRFETIFVTAFTEYAIKAFNFSASYYILKPVDIQELTKAVDKVKTLINHQSSPNVSNILYENFKFPENKKLVLPTTNGFEVILVNTIIRLCGSSNYTEIYLMDGKKKVVSRVLKFFEDLLSDQGFMRIHKSHIINLEQVKRYHKGKGGSIELSDGSEVEVSPTKKQELLARFK